jgi:VIT1/CCC1 family predicted Fe2+/Mn2+ transporter
MDTHLHHEQHFKSSDTLRDIVIGMADGLTVPFALAAGLSGAVANNKIILTAGIAEIIAGSIAMGLGGYLAGKTEVDHYNAELKREYDETYLYPEREKEEVREVFAEYGLSAEHQQIVVEALAKDRDKWVDFMMRFELGLEKPDPDRARQSALNIGGAYIVGGMIPLSTYWFFDETAISFRWSVIITLIALALFGYFKNKIIGQNPISGAFRTALIGAAAAGTAYFVASWLG